MTRLFYQLYISVLLIFPAQVLFAHHSVPGQFDMSHEVEWTGVIVKIDWINPHTYIYLEVMDADGNKITWRLESVPTAMMRKAGLTREMIMGDGAVVTIRGLVARDGTRHLGFVNRITYPDGHFYQFGRSPP